MPSFRAKNPPCTVRVITRNPTLECIHEFPDASPVDVDEATHGPCVRRLRGSFLVEEVP